MVDFMDAREPRYVVADCKSQIKVPTLSQKTRKEWGNESAFSSSLYLVSLLGREKTENSDAVGGADIDFAMGDHDGVEFVTRPELIAATRGLVGVEDLDESSRIVGVQYGRSGVFGSPNNGVLASIGGNAGCGTGIRE